MVFEIKQNSTLPILKMRMVLSDYKYQNQIYKLMENATCIFSMYDEKNERYKILNKKGEIHFEEDLFESNYSYTVTISYKFSKRDTNTVGYYRGEFLIKFLDDCFDELRVPIREPLFINIKPSMTTVDIVSNSNC